MTFPLRCVVFIAAMLPSTGFACSVSRIQTPYEVVAGADVIVRAVASAPQAAPAKWHLWPTPEPDPVVSFKVVEVVHGDGPRSFTLPGYLVNDDDFNDRPVPYDFVRPGGRAGNCVAETYRSGAEYLLLMKRAKDSSALNVRWAALAPVNEQVRGDHDPWLLWVKKQAKASAH